MLSHRKGIFFFRGEETRTSPSAEEKPSPNQKKKREGEVGSPSFKRVLLGKKKKTSKTKGMKRAISGGRIQKEGQYGVMPFI